MKIKSKVISKSSGLEVLVSGTKPKDGEYFSGTVTRQAMGHYRVGKHRIDWLKSNFRTLESA